MLTLLGVLALSTSITVNYWTLAFIGGELDYDSFHQDANSIYRVLREGTTATIATTAFPLVPTLQSEYPEVVSSRIFKDRSKVVFRKQDRTFFESKMVWADSNFLRVFTFENFVGNANTALRDPLSIVITGEVRDRYLPGIENPIGENLEFSWNGKQYLLLITGFIEKLPPNTHLDFDILISFASGMQLFPGGITDNWKMNYCYSYVKLPENMAPEKLTSSFPGLANKHIDFKEGEDWQQYFATLQPLSDIHLNSNVLGGLSAPVNFRYLIIVASLSVVILIVSAFNYINLSVVDLQSRIKELAVRKTLGASRTELMQAFLREQVVKLMLSVTLGSFLLILILPIWNTALGTSLNLDQIFEASYILINYGAGLLVVSFAASYAVYVSRGIKSIQSSENSGSGGIIIRKVILALQLIISIVMIAVTFVINDQLRLMLGYDLGYAKEHTLIIPQGRQVRDNPDLLKTRFNALAGVSSVALSMYKPGDVVGNKITVKKPGSNEELAIAANSVDEHFFSSYQIPLETGVAYSREHLSNPQSYIVINQSAAKLLELDDPIGVVLESEFSTGQPSMPVELRSSRVIGVVTDIHFEPLHNSIEPMVFLIKPYWYFYISVKISGENVPTTVAALNKEWDNLFPSRPFDYFFLDSALDETYRKEQQLSTALQNLVVVVGIVALLGLYAISAYTMRSKTKELSIRKVLGAGYFSLAQMLTKELVVIMLVAAVIAAPIALLIGDFWLQQFATKTNSGLSYLLLAIIITCILALAVLFNQVLKHVLQNPATHLRNE